MEGRRPAGGRSIARIASANEVAIQFSPDRGCPMTAGPDTLTIIVPVLDEAAEIVAALQPLQELRAKGVELIVVDGGSADGSLELAAPLADRVLTAARGRARQMNAGAALATGRILLFLHADTRLPAAADRLIADALHPGCGRHWGRFDVRIEGHSGWLPLVAALMNLRSRLTGIATGDQAMFVSREAFAAAGGFPDIPLMEDIAFSGRLRKRAAPACLAEKVVTSGRRWDRHGVWRTIGRMWWLRLRFFLGADPHRLAVDYGYVPR
jgi:rSAM/selenodomain-associated transferase 2